MPIVRKNDEPAEWTRIHGLLSDWSRKQVGRDEDGIDWPAPAILDVAINLARLLEGRGLSPPTRVVPNGEEGVVFEFQHERQLQTIEVDAEGCIELCRFEDAKLTDRKRFPCKPIDVSGSL